MNNKFDNNNISYLRFEENKFDYIIVLNAKIAESTFFDSFQNIKIVASDGAATKLLDIGIVCDYLIGDLDSITDDIISSKLMNSVVVKDISQNTNDFEKILLWCIENNKTNIIISGFHGGELEHTLNNWSVLMKYSEKINMCIYDEGRYGIAVNKSISFDSYKGEIISIIPQPKAIISTTNLKWELDEFTLELGRNEGARNESVGQKIEIILHLGSFLLFFDSKVPKCPFF